MGVKRYKRDNKSSGIWQATRDMDHSTRPMEEQEGEQRGKKGIRKTEELGRTAL